MATIKSNFFKLLYEDFMQKAMEDYTKKYGKAATIVQIFKLDGYDENKGDTVAEFMSSLSTIESYMKASYPNDKWKQRISPKYMYNKKSNDFNKKKKDITFSKPYDKIIPLYLGYSTLAEYIKAKESENNWEEYTGYYYSYKNHSIRNYSLRICRNISNDIEPYAEYKVKEEGFHDDDENPEYEGYAYRLHGSKLHIVLNKFGLGNNDITDKLKLVFDSGANPLNPPVMRGSILAISAGTQGNPILSMETVIVKNKHTSTLPTKLRIERYLFLHRCNYWIRPEAIRLERLIVNRNVNVNQISHLVGTYRVWRFNDDYKIVQSKLIIKENYEAICHTDFYEDHPRFNKQVCILRINNIDLLDGSKTVCIATHPIDGTGLISHIMLKYVGKQKWKKMHPKLLGGTLSFVGGMDTLPTLRSIVLQWEGITEEDNKEIPLETLPADKVETHKETKEDNKEISLKTLSIDKVQTHEETKEMLKLLLNLTKNNIPPFNVDKYLKKLNN